MNIKNHGPWKRYGKIDTDRSFSQQINPTRKWNYHMEGVLKWL
jgi:hypothetical protein